jgi:hypothetical protein
MDRRLLESITANLRLAGSYWLASIFGWSLYPLVFSPPTERIAIAVDQIALIALTVISVIPALTLLGSIKLLARFNRIRRPLPMPAAIAFFTAAATTFIGTYPFYEPFGRLPYIVSKYSEFLFAVLALAFLLAPIRLAFFLTVPTPALNACPYEPV